MPTCYRSLSKLTGIAAQFMALASLNTTNYSLNEACWEVTVFIWQSCGKKQFFVYATSERWWLDAV